MAVVFVQNLVFSLNVEILNNTVEDEVDEERLNYNHIQITDSFETIHRFRIHMKMLFAIICSLLEII